MLLVKAAYLNKHPDCHHVASVALQNSAPSGPALVNAAYSIRLVASPEPLAGLFKVVREVVRNNSAVLVTLDRYNTSLVRDNSYDQIIDICISLESIVESSTEIKFRFSLYNALVAERDPVKRSEAFQVFQTLYDARSAIVHGDIRSKSNAKKIDATKENMKEIQRMAVTVITYYLLYHFKTRRKTWRDHLDGLALGADSHVTD